jgi:hypothetical protein
MVLASFSRPFYRAGMSDDPAKLSPANPDELRLAISLALQRDGRRRFRHGDDLMAKLVADHIIRCLEERNYVVMRKPPAGDFSGIARGAKSEE